MTQPIQQAVERPRPRFNPDDMPVGIRRLPVDARGYPVPWFVDLAAPYINGNPDFRVMDGARLKAAVREKRCWVCGMKLREGAFAFLAGPMCGINRNNAEPPCHIDCAQWSAKACPFLSHPKRIRDTRDLPAHHSQAGVGIKRNPGVAMVWVCDSYKTWRPPSGGILFDLGEPIRVEWVCEGREATRVEVMESVETGLPLLLEPAARQSAEACFALGRMTERFLKWLPPHPLEDRAANPQDDGKGL